MANTAMPDMVATTQMISKITTRHNTNNKLRRNNGRH